MLWARNISAELARDARSPEDLMSKHRDESYSWIITIKQDSMVKIKSVARKDVPDVDMATTQVFSWLRAEIRERESKSLVKSRLTTTSQSEASTVADKDREQDVKVLVAQTKSKKFNRRTVVEQAQTNASKLVNSFLDGPILAVETTDQVMELVRDTCLSEPESWRKVEHAVTTSEKKYVREMQVELNNWRWKYENSGDGTRHSFLYNFRTGSCLYYDLGA
jgi:translation initiation factor 2-alpha kinase 4